MKWLRIGMLGVALVFLTVLAYESEGDPIFLIIYMIIFIPALASALAVAAAIGAVIGAIISGKKQVRSLKESAASGSAETHELDKMRMKVQTANLAYKAGIVLGVILCVYILFSFSALWAFIFAITATFVLLRLKNSIGPMTREYESAFKERIVKTGLETVLNNMVFEPAKSLDENEAKASQLFPKFDAISGNDYLSAEYKGRRFTQSDIRLQVENKGNNVGNDSHWKLSEQYKDVFMGRLMIFDYDAISDEPVFVFDRRTHRLVGSVTNTELEAFNRKFIIQASDAATAFRILTPPVLEGIALASDKLNCPMSLSFLNDKIYIAISNGNSFEANTYSDATLTEQRKQVYEEVQTVLDMVETLYLK
jgi:hypothetical protein